MRPRLDTLPLLLGAGLALVACSASTDRDRYGPGNGGQAVFHNHSLETLYLEGCSAFGFEKLEGEAWSWRGPSVVCFWEGFAQPVEPGTSWSSSFAVPEESGSWRLRTIAGSGCDPQQPLSATHCQAVFPVYTPPFVVQELCDPLACGPPLGMPNRLCEDGISVAGPTGRCLRDPDAALCGWEVLGCPEDASASP